MKRLFLAVLLFPFIAIAEDLDMASEEALQNTKKMLGDVSERQKIINIDPSSAKADQELKKTVGAQNVEKVYGLSGGIFERLVRETGGDQVKLQKLLDDLQRNPASLDAYLTPEQRLEIKKMADDLAKQKK